MWLGGAACQETSFVILAAKRHWDRPRPFRAVRQQSIELARIAQKAQSEKRLAACSERGPRRETSLRLIHQTHRQPAHVPFAIHLKKQVERPARHNEATARRLPETATNDLAALPGAR